MTKDDEIQRTLREIEALVGRLKSVVKQPPAKYEPRSVMCQENISAVADWP